MDRAEERETLELENHIATDDLAVGVMRGGSSRDGHRTLVGLVLGGDGEQRPVGGLEVALRVLHVAERLEGQAGIRLVLVVVVARDRPAIAVEDADAPVELAAGRGAPDLKADVTAAGETVGEQRPVYELLRSRGGQLLAPEGDLELAALELKHLPALGEVVVDAGVL